jgi:hypothetical protein
MKRYDTSIISIQCRVKTEGRTKPWGMGPWEKVLFEPALFDTRDQVHGKG